MSVEANENARERRIRLDMLTKFFLVVGQDEAEAATKAKLELEQQHKKCRHTGRIRVAMAVEDSGKRYKTFRGIGIKVYCSRIWTASI